jgi:methylglutaconyl-CoA hydratase
MVSSEYKSRVGVITLARPEKKNALNDVMVKKLLTEVEALNNNPECRAIWFRAEGNTFSAGADLAYLEKLRDNSIEENFKDSITLGKLFYSIYTSPKITISEVSGYALAGGCGLATICDYCFATNESNFGYTESKIGFIPALVMIFLLKKMNHSQAMDLLLSGKIINAEQAFEIGLITEIVSENQNAEENISQFLDKIIKTTSANSIKTIKEMRDQITFDGKLWEQIEYAARKNAEARSSADCIKGIDAFLNKENIEW